MYLDIYHIHLELFHAPPFALLFPESLFVAVYQIQQLSISASHSSTNHSSFSSQEPCTQRLPQTKKHIARRQMKGRRCVPFTHEFVNGDTAISCFEDDMFTCICSSPSLHRERIRSITLCSAMFSSIASDRYVAEFNV